MPLNPDKFGTLVVRPSQNRMAQQATGANENRAETAVQSCMADLDFHFRLSHSSRDSFTSAPHASHMLLASSDRVKGL
jgi:hypothetical protein